MAFQGAIPCWILPRGASLSRAFPTASSVQGVWGFAMEVVLPAWAVAARTDGGQPVLCNGSSNVLPGRAIRNALPLLERPTHSRVKRSIAA